MAEEGLAGGSLLTLEGYLTFWPLFPKGKKFLNSALHEAEKLIV